MTTADKCTWTGASKKDYIYLVFQLPADFREKQEGNYIFAKLTDEQWQPIYIGQGDLGKRITKNHHKAACIGQKGATHIHVHLNSDETERLIEEADLLNNHPEAYEPDGCNEKAGG
jgi:hypothetical protein